MKPYKTISKKVLYQNPYWRYCCDRIELPSGKAGEYHYVLTYGSSMIVAETDAGKFLMVRQYRYTGNRESLEFPCGGVEEGSTHDETARRELAEETGFEAGMLKPIGGFNPCNGLLDEICRVYRARDLRPTGAHPDETESFELAYLTESEIDAFIGNGTIWDGMTIAAWGISKSCSASS